MGSATHQATTEGASHKGLTPELNKESRNGTAGEGQAQQSVSDKDESRADITQNEHVGDVGPPTLSGQQSGAQKQQQGGQVGPIIRWERFLPVKTLKVLLVENDDSTRHVVSALLRNCSYEVITAANGIQAWKILEDLMNHIDLVLTEVVMPYLSGIGLLGKIMSHKTCKNIPVIMMSSNDSMGTVFKCLSKGAVDFLVKPIRKNELKNLWQHVWRRCHSSSGSGSESGIQMQKGEKTNSGDESDNKNNSSNSSTDDNENTSIGLNVRDGSDNGSGTQSSWTKWAVEVESPQAMSASDQLAGPPVSTCAQVIHPKAEIYCNGWLPLAPDTRNNSLPQKDSNDEFMGKDLEIGVPGKLNAELGSPKPAGTSTEKLPDSGPKTEGVTGGSASFDKLSTQAADLIGSIAAQHGPTTGPPDAPSNFPKLSDRKDKTTGECTKLPSLELSLKRLRSAGDLSMAPPLDDRNVLRRSDQSAFTWYHTSVAAPNQVPTGGYGGSCSPLDNTSSDAVKTNSTNKSNNATPIKQGSNGSSNNDDMGSTTKNVFKHRPNPTKEKVSSPSAIKNGQHTSAFHPVQFQPAPATTTTTTSPPPQVIQDKGGESATEATAAAAQAQPREIHRQVQVQHHHHHHYHHHHHHVHQPPAVAPPPPPTNCSTLPLDSLSSAASGTHVSPPNVFTLPVEGQAANYSVNGSNSVSNHVTNVHNGNSTEANVGGGVNFKSANGVAEKSGNGNGSGSGSGVCQNQNQNRLAQREAALNKFRQKRKERNFGKKVRYQSRKKLAEQRPRIRGQFVRQSVHQDQPDSSER